MKKFTFIAGPTGGLTLFAGILFKVMHWQGADQLILVGGIIFALFMIPKIVRWTYPGKTRIGTK